MLGIVKKISIKDTYVDSNKEHDNFCFENEIKLGEYGGRDNTGAWGFIKIFGLENIPQNASITKATLSMYLKRNYEDYSYIRIAVPTENWNLNEINWNNKPTWNNNSVEIKKVSDEEERYSFNVTDFIQMMITGSIKNYGLQLKAHANEGTEVYFYSNECGIEEKKPYIEVEYEMPCNPPVNLEPFENKVINLTNKNRFSWNYIQSFNEDNQKEFELKWSNNNLSWHTIKTYTSNTFVDILENIFPEGYIFWKVKVKNQQDKWSQYSNVIKIIATKKPDIPIITTPNLINVFKPTIKWEDMQTQYSFMLEVKTLDNILLWNSEKIISNSNEYVIGIDLENKTSYKILLKVINKYGLESDLAEKIITTNFQTPIKPKIYLLQENNSKGIIIRAINSTSGIRVIRNEIFRKESGTKNFIRIAKIGVNDSYTDYAVKSCKTYKYYIRAVGETLGYVNSNTQNSSIKIRHNIITDVATNKHIMLKYNPQRAQNIKLEKQSFNFVGRKNKVTEFAEYEENNIEFNFSVLDTNIIKDLIALYKSKNKLLYRDNRGRKMFCTMDNLRIQDEKHLKYKVSFTLSQEDYNEEVL